MMNENKKYIIICLCIIFCCITYLYAHKTKIVVLDKLVYTYNNLTDEVTIHTPQFSRTIKNETNTTQINPRKNITVTAKYNVDNGCTEEFPVELAIANNSNDTILDLALKLDVREKNRNGSQVISSTSPRYVDFVIPSYSSSRVCFTMPALKEKFDPNTMEIYPYELEYTFLKYPGGNKAIRDRFTQ